jgi:hypothetical protein
VWRTRDTALFATYLCYWGRWELDTDRFFVRKVRHQGGHLSHWIFTPAAELHRPSMEVLKRYGTLSQATYAYCLVDHLNWAHLNGNTPETVTFDDLHRYMNGVTGESDGIYGVAWRRPEQEPLGSSAACNVASIVKAYYVSLSASHQVNLELVEALTSGRVISGRRRANGLVEANPLAPKRPVRRPRFLPDEVVEALFAPGVLTTSRDVMIVTWLHDEGLFSRVQSPCAGVVL